MILNCNKECLTRNLEADSDKIFSSILLLITNQRKLMKSDLLDALITNEIIKVKVINLYCQNKSLVY